jgi:predicted permease
MSKILFVLALVTGMVAIATVHILFNAAVREGNIVGAAGFVGSYVFLGLVCSITASRRKA